MKYTDYVFGQIEIKEPVILELINCSAIQRLKDIDQAGYFEPYFPGTKHTRFEHSMGCYMLLNRYNASLEEQILGLIHDVSHSVFSHCIDHILNNGTQANQSHQDDIFGNYVRTTDIPLILEKYGFDPDYILDEYNFPLQERGLPDLCADRIDYSLRTAVLYIKNFKPKVEGILNSIKVVDNHWVFVDYTAAREYAELFYRFNREFYTGIPTALMFKSVEMYMRHALEKEYITADDLYTTDTFVISKINKNLVNDKKLAYLWKKMNTRQDVVNDENNYDTRVICKSRVIDPLHLDNGTIRRVSDNDPKWRDVVRKESVPKEYYLKFMGGKESFIY